MPSAVDLLDLVFEDLPVLIVPPYCKCLFPIISVFRRDRM